jgi:hypothetical protein
MAPRADRRPPAGEKAKGAARPLAFALLIVAALAGCRPPADPSLGAKEACRDFVRERLRVPLSARFPDPASFAASPGKPKAGASSAGPVAATLSNGLADPLRGARLIDLQLKVLDDEQLARIGSLAGSGDRDGARGVLQAALARRFERSDYIVTGHVEAQDGSGAMTRSNFVCLTSAAGGNSWRYDGVALGY